jgi:Spy/CpxP family protein refolding chaperone
MKSQKILIAGLILMVVVNICTLGFIIYKSQHRHYRNDREKHGSPGKFLSKRLHMNAEQEQSLDKLRKENEKKMSVLRARKDSLRKQSFELIKSDVYDITRADEIANEIGNCHKEMEKQMATYFLAIKALCTKEQLADFNKFIDHIAEVKQQSLKRHHKDSQGF